MGSRCARLLVGPPYTSTNENDNAYNKISSSIWGPPFAGGLGRGFKYALPTSHSYTIGYSLMSFLVLCGGCSAFLFIFETAYHIALCFVALAVCSPKLRAVHSLGMVIGIRLNFIPFDHLRDNTKSCSPFFLHPYFSKLIIRQ